MAILNLNELIPSPVRDMVGVVGLAALGLAAVVFVVALWVMSRHPAGDANTPAGVPLPRIVEITIKSLVLLGLNLLLIWGLPWIYAHADGGGPYPPAPPFGTWGDS